MVEIEYLGGNCVKIKNKKASLIVDDNLESLGLKNRTTDDSVALVTSKDIEVKSSGRFRVDCPGEYEISEISIKGIAHRSHLDEAGKRTTSFVIRISGIVILVLGHVHPDMTDEQLEELGMIDILIIPVGGSGYTLDPVGAVKIANKIDPKIVIPTHYADKDIKYPVPQVALDEFVKICGTPDPERINHLKIKETDLGDKMHTVIVERS